MGIRLLTVVTVAAALAFADGGARAQAITSVYTPLDLAKCRHAKGRDAEDYGSWTCKGHDGIAVRVTAGDQRTQVSFGPRAARELAMTQTLASFNSAGAAVEWRLEKRGTRATPFAAILRWNTTVSTDGEPVRGQVLVVTRLGPGGVCHVGYVDARANANANALARDIADRSASGFRCGIDKPVVLGEKGPGFSGPYGDKD